MRVEIYVHADDDEALDALGRSGVGGKSLYRLGNIAYEVKLTYSVNPETGEYSIIAVDDMLVSHDPLPPEQELKDTQPRISYDRYRDLWLATFSDGTVVQHADKTALEEFLDANEQRLIRGA